MHLVTQFNVTDASRMVDELPGRMLSTGGDCQQHWFVGIAQPVARLTCHDQTLISSLGNSTAPAGESLATLRDDTIPDIPFLVDIAANQYAPHHDTAIQLLGRLRRHTYPVVSRLFVTNQLAHAVCLPRTAQAGATKEFPVPGCFGLPPDPRAVDHQNCCTAQLQPGAGKFSRAFQRARGQRPGADSGVTRHRNNSGTPFGLPGMPGDVVRRFRTSPSRLSTSG